MPRKTTHAVGRAIESNRKKRAEQPVQKSRVTGVAESQDKRSVLEQSSLNDFLATAELADATFESTRGQYFIDEGPRLVSMTKTVAGSLSAAVHGVVVPVPRRPAWDDAMGAEELAQREGESFLEWRRALAKMEEEKGLIMTPYEKNLDFWRQLWRTVERCDVLVQILDARDPLFYRSRDLERYVSELPGKRHLLLLNKADFLPAEHRRRWASYFAGLGVEAIFFSALRELHRQQRFACPGAGEPCRNDEGTGVTESEAVPLESHGSAVLPPHGPLQMDDPDVFDCSGLLEEIRARLPKALPAGCDAPNTLGGARHYGTVGFVGYPNVGKSSVINALFGAKKVSMSRTPGKTKHLQTLELPEAGITLCDCPGLVFPSVVATKAHLTINGTVPLVELRDALPPVRLVVEKVGVAKVLEKYGLTMSALCDGAMRRGERVSDGDVVSADPARDMLAGFAAARQHFLRFGVPDETWAARRVLRDFCTGELLHCEPPPACGSGAEEAAGAPEVRSSAPIVTAAAATAASALTAPAPGDAAANAADSDFSDLDDFLGVHRGESAKDGAARRKG
eukprot:CAMPEP_0117570976 /NCGR_PEP_ID=MMETSP0784-20121206/59492_1 /TAXON_ID=39447 /ORGANISM="" /LENGTH=566 /DNA_ID=CAMNT_0005369079 /DNA_START=88 /DNA_END=1784 /DNA_ORIENTATION=-